MTAILNKGFPWNRTKWVLENDYCVDYGKSNINWESPDGWLAIKDGIWKIKAGFIWDGCTDIDDFEDDLDPVSKKPKVYFPSLCHDIGYRYLIKCAKDFPYSKLQIDWFFFRLGKKYKFRPIGIYFFGVILFGWYYILKKKTVPQDNDD